MNNPGSLSPGLSSCSGALTIELDLQDPRYNPVPPAPLDRETAAAVGGRIAADLNRILQGIDHLGMVVPGALYDQTELLRPGFPLLRTLEELFRGALRNADFTHQFERELGTLAYTVLALDGNGRTVSLEHLYPLRPEGLRQIIEQLRRRGAAPGVDYQVLHPPTLVYSATGRCLESARP